MRELRYAPRVQRRLSFLAFSALTFTIATPEGLAQSAGARLVRVLDGVGRSELLSDGAGKISVSAVLPSGVSAASLGLVPFGDGTASMRLTPAEVIALGMSQPDLEIFVGPPLRPLLDVSKTSTRVAQFRKETGFTGKGVAIGVIDTGIDILHADFRHEDGTTRIKWLLQTGIDGGKHPELEEEYCGQWGRQCAIFNEGDVNALLAKGESGGTFDASGHGSHVASIAAGNGGLSVNAKPRYVGVAPGADLIIGAMESFQDEDVSWTAKFVFDRADEMKVPCVLNLSIGSDYGAHDGSDILGRRLSRFVGDDKPGHAIVAAAGNSGGLYLFEGEKDPWGIHTETRVYEDSEVRVPIYAPESKSGRGFLWVTFQPGDEVSVGLEGPGGRMWIEPVAPEHERGYEDGPNTAGIVNNVFKEGAALVPVTNGAVVVFAGEWAENSEFAVHLRGRGEAQMWLTSTGDLADTYGLLFKRGIRQGTINVPASAPALLAVGCTLNRLVWPTVNGPNKAVQLGAFGVDLEPQLDSVCYFSSAGPTPAGVAKPELSAPGGYIGAAMAVTADPRTVPGGLFDTLLCPPGVPNCYVLDEQHAIAAGTSMSSPHVAGAVALLFESNPKLTQAKVTAILQAGARYPKGKVPNEVQLGAGALDLMGALQALVDEPADLDEPDVTKSWFVLSSAYARPETSWPVWGTVELRLAGGEVPRALDGTFLTLDVQNGVVVQPLAKIRNGLFRFAVAGDVGQSGQEMTIDVRYAGQSLGVKSLPISNDVWTSREAMDAVGGCAVTGGTRAPDGSAWGWAAAAIAGIAAARRRIISDRGERRRC